MTNRYDGAPLGSASRCPIAVIRLIFPKSGIGHGTVVVSGKDRLPID